MPRGTRRSITPFCHLRLSGKKPRPLYPKAPQTLGERLRKRRLDLDLSIKQAARRIGVFYKVLERWERGVNLPSRSKLPGVIDFLGYDPDNLQGPLAERLKAARERQGLSQQALAEQLGVDDSTIRAIEQGTRPKRRRVLRAVEAFLGEGGGI
jgi:transcriptional regulator with XRE-family HTH domain